MEDKEEEKKWSLKWAKMSWLPHEDGQCSSVVQGCNPKPSGSLFLGCSPTINCWVEQVGKVKKKQHEIESKEMIEPDVKVAEF